MTTPTDHQPSGVLLHDAIVDQLAYLLAAGQPGVTWSVASRLSSSTRRPILFESGAMSQGASICMRA